MKEYEAAVRAGRSNLYRTAHGTAEEDETGCRSKEIQAGTAAIFHEVESCTAASFSLVILIGTL